eukprot:1134904-Pleurochrysis_carterae.AAC.2
MAYAWHGRKRDCVRVCRTSMRARVTTYLCTRVSARSYYTRMHVFAHASACRRPAPTGCVDSAGSGCSVSHRFSLL